MIANFLGCDFELSGEARRITITLCYIYAICFLLLRITYPCCGVTQRAFSVPFTTQFKSLLLYFHFLDLTKLRILNIFFTFSMRWNAEGKKFQICMKCSIFHTDVLNWKKKKNDPCYICVKFPQYKWMLCHSLHIKVISLVWFDFKHSYV